MVLVEKSNAVNRHMEIVGNSVEQIMERRTLNKVSPWDLEK